MVVDTSLYVIYCRLRCGQRGSTCARHITLDWIGLWDPATQRRSGDQRIVSLDDTVFVANFSRVRNN